MPVQSTCAVEDCRQHVTTASSVHATDKLSADDFAKCFVDKVAKIRASTAAAAAPVIIPRDVVPPLTEFEPTSVSEISQLLSLSLIHI